MRNSESTIIPNVYFAPEVAHSANTNNYFPTRPGKSRAIFVLPLTYLKKIFKVKVLFGYSAPLVQYI